MNREEAIKMLKYNSNVIHQTINGETDHKEVEALDMAIEALEQQPVLDKIRDEIADLDDTDYDFEGYYKAVTDALQIIDKYKTASERVE